MTVADLLKAFGSDIVGPHLAPAAIAAVIGVWTVPPWLEETFLSSAGTVARMATPDKLGLAAGIAVVTGLLFRILGLTQIRFYEGYIGPEWILSRMRNRQLEKYRSIQRQYERLKEIPPDERSSEDKVSLTRLAFRLEYHGAPRESLVLPTRLGNVFRAMEGYPNRRYGFDGVTMWPRLEPLLPEKVRENTVNARGHVEILLTTCTLAWMFAMLFLIVSFKSPGAALAALSSGVAAYMMYRMAIVAAASFGTATRAAFDIGRDSLLAVWGYESPHSLEAEKELWDEISGLILYAEPLTKDRTTRSTGHNART